MRAWPKETARTANPASLPEWLVLAGRERSEDPVAKRRIRRYVLFYGCVIVPWLLVTVVLPSSLLSWGMLAGLGLLCFVSVSQVRRLLRRDTTRRRDGAVERAAMIGEPTLDAEFVGVDYADAAWLYPGLGINADEGLLRLEMDRLVFHGQDTRFELPAHAIHGLEIRRREAGLGVLPCLVLRWAHGGEAGTVVLNLPLGGSLRRRVRDAESLGERIERWQREPFPYRTAPVVLPPSVKPTVLAVIPPKVGLLAKTLAAVSMMLGFMVAIIAFDVAFRLAGHPEIGQRIGSTGGVFAVPSMGIWLVFSQKIEKRLPARWRHPENAASPEALPDAARDDEEETLRVRA